MSEVISLALAMPPLEAAWLVTLADEPFALDGPAPLINPERLAAARIVQDWSN